MAADGEQGFKAMMAKPAHLVISDFNMPKLDGLAFLRAVRSYPPTQKAAFILLTGRGDKELIERAQKLGVNNVIAKPFTLPVLKSQIEAVVGAPQMTLLRADPPRVNPRAASGAFISFRANITSATIRVSC